MRTPIQVPPHNEAFGSTKMGVARGTAARGEVVLMGWGEYWSEKVLNATTTLGATRTQYNG